MKQSIYNYIIKQDDVSYWFNGLNFTYFQLPIQLSDKLEKCISNIPALSQSLPVFYEQLKKKVLLYQMKLMSVKLSKTSIWMQLMIKITSLY